MKTIHLYNIKTIDEQAVEIYIKDGKISKPLATVDTKINGNGAYVSAGWIDMHVHAYDKLMPYGDRIDDIGFKQGVCTIVDAGSCGINNIDELCHAENNAITNVYKLINIAPNGLETINELVNLELLEVDKIIEEWERLEVQNVVGIKVRLSRSVIGDNGIIPLKIGQHLSKRLKTKLMLHIGNGPPSIDDVFNELEEGNIVTHIFHGKKENIVNKERIRSSVMMAYDRGVYFDIGFGTDSFSFEVCRKAYNLGVCCDTISSDIYRKNRKYGPVYSLSDCMSKMLHIGYSKEVIIKAVTKNPATILSLSNKGGLDIGMDADLTLFELKAGEFKITDSLGEEETCNFKFNPTQTVIAGQICEVEDEQSIK